MSKVSTTDKRTRHGEFIDKELKRIRHKPYVKVGILAENFGDEKKTSESTGKGKGKAKTKTATLGEVAVYNEFGTSDGRIPERSFIRWTHDHKKKEWIKRTDELRKQLMAGKITNEQALGLMGEMIQQDIKDRIMSNIPPANTDATVAAKTRDGNAGDRTLINFGQLLGSVHWSRHDGNN